MVRPPVGATAPTQRVFYAAARAQYSRCEAGRPGKQAADEADACGRHSSNASDRPPSASGRRQHLHARLAISRRADEAASWCSLASAAGDRVAERKRILAGGRFAASACRSHTLAAVASVPPVLCVPRWQRSLLTFC